MRQYKKLCSALLILILLTVLTAVGVSAGPANPIPREMTQADGSVVSVKTCGDEFFNWTEEENGYLICYDETSENWCYAVLNADNDLVAGSEIVGSADASAARGSAGVGVSRLTYEDIASIASAEAAEAKKASALPVGNTGLSSSSSSSSSPAFPASGSSGVQSLKNNEQDLVLMLIEYTDVSLVNGIDFWTNRYFGTDGKTVNNFYMDQSGDFGLRFNQIKFKQDNGFVELSDDSVIQSMELRDGVAKIKFNKKHPTYANQSQVDEDVKTAFSYLKEYIDFNKYKYAGDAVYGNYIRQEYFQVVSVVAGWEMSAGNAGKTQGIWAHANYSYFDTEDGRIQVAVNHAELEMGNGQVMPAFSLLSYMLHGELYSGNSTSADDSTVITMGVGVSVHELGHCLGMPDLYDIGGKESGGLSVYSVMAAGSWGAKKDETPGTTPIGFDAWSKMVLGFASPTVIDAAETNQTAVLRAPTDSYNMLKLTSSEVNPRQYFLVENRQLKGYDEGMEMYDLGLAHNNGGICIYLIDEDVITSGSNPVSNAYHFGIELLFADGSQILREKDHRWFSEYSPFFTGDGYSEFPSDVTTSQFFVAGHTSKDPTLYEGECHLKNVDSGISLKVLSVSGDEMTVLVNEKVFICGDVNEDGSVTAADRVLLARYLAGWEGYKDCIYIQAADVNGDGAVDSDDLRILSRYCAAWNGYESLPMQETDAA